MREKNRENKDKTDVRRAVSVKPPAERNQNQEPKLKDIFYYPPGACLLRCNHVRSKLTSVANERRNVPA